MFAGTTGRACRRHLAPATRAFSSRLEALRSRLREEESSSTLDDFLYHRPQEGAEAPNAMAFAAQMKSGDAPRSEPAPALFDRFRRPHTYLRVSLTERCSLRCVYCMPEGGVDLTPNARLLSVEETLRLASVFVRAGVDKIRLTGGEPTVRRDIVDVVAALNELRPTGLRTIAMTSNGIALPRLLPQLHAAGLDKLNISLDTLNREAFVSLTRRDGLAKVLRGIDLGIELGMRPLKVNCVLIAGQNEHEMLDFARLTLAKPIDVRFIEYMPFGGNNWEEDTMVPQRAVLQTLQQTFDGIESVPTDKHDVAVSWRLPGAVGTVSFISSMTQPFCSGCNRLRLTADGNLKVCLFGSDELSLRDALRGGASDDELLVLVGGALQKKHARHAGLPVDEIVRNTSRPMTTIGG